MENEIYKSPDSNLGNSSEDNKPDIVAIGNRSAKFVLLALVISPLVTSIFYCGFAIFLDFIRSLIKNTEGSLQADIVLMLFAISFGASFLFSLVVGMPLNWFLLRINQLKVIYFLLAGAITPVFFAITGSGISEVTTLLQMSATGALCLGIFWYVAAYWPSRPHP